MNERVETIKAWCLEQVGCPYIYGATGQACTPEYRRARMAQYPEYADKIKRNCPRMSGGATSCIGCKWAKDGTGRLAYDCAQLTRFAMKQAGIALVSGANSQWRKTAFVLNGKIEDMPRGMMCLVYRDDGGNMGHTGVYLADGYVEHAKGHDYGVVRERLEDTKFTDFGLPAGLYSDQELRDAGIDTSGNVPTLRRGSTGKVVKDLQLYLNAKTGAGLEPDGVFGDKTEEAVKAFQRDNGLTDDGIVGPKTWVAMGGAPEDDEIPEAPDMPPDEPEDGAEAERPEAHPPDVEMVSVPKDWLIAMAEDLEDMALDLRGRAGKM